MLKIVRLLATPLFSNRVLKFSTMIVTETSASPHLTATDSIPYKTFI